MLKMKKRTERKTVDGGTGNQKEDEEQLDREREGGDLRQEFKSRATSADGTV